MTDQANSLAEIPLTFTMPKGVYLPVIVVCLLLAAGLRFYRLDVQSFWNDEGNSARIAERSVALILDGAGGDIHPPGYYLLLAGWRSVLGASEFGLRSFSALAGVLTVAVMSTIGAQFFDRRVGALTALMIALSPFHIYYSQEARMYALLALLSAASILLTVQVLKLPNAMRQGHFNGRKAVLQIGGLIAVNTLGLYTHYSFPFVLLAESIVFLIWLASRERKGHGLLTWILIQGASLLLFAPWIGIAVRQILGWPAGGADSLSLEIWTTVLGYGETLTPEQGTLGMVSLLLLAAAGVFPPLEERPSYLSFPERIGLIAFWVLVPLVALVPTGILSESFLKFLLPASLGLHLLAVRGFLIGFDMSQPNPLTGMFTSLAWRSVFVVFATLALVPAFRSLNNLYYDPSYARDNYRGIARQIAQFDSDEVAIVLTAPNQWEVFTYYYPDGANVAPLPDESTQETLDRLLDDYERIYALYWGVEQQDPDGQVEARLTQDAFPVQSAWYGEVRLVSYAVPALESDDEPIDVDAQFGDTIQLSGYKLSNGDLMAGDALGVTLYWQADKVISTRYKVFVHLYADDDTLISQHDAEPANNANPTVNWTPGDVIVDNHGLLVPPEVAPGRYQLAIGLYDFSGARLPIRLEGESIGERLVLQEIVIGE
ncbi:MAG: phospholipid carrier-dependent glycosyltransferase [Chloroflexi bacterium]|nr:phospholipid carrier-dependent glycosyltransferase [Chloroflexota bacterium]